MEEIVSSENHTFIRLGNEIMSCGNNEFSQLGQGDFKNRYYFGKIKFEI